MSSVVAFTTTRSRESRRPASVVSLEAARARRAGTAQAQGDARRAAMANHPASRGGAKNLRAADLHTRDQRLVAVDVDWSRVAPEPLRLTRRGRVVAGVIASVVLLVALVAGILLIGHPASAGEQSVPVTAIYHVVLPGETLWSIAGEVAPTSDRRDTVSRLVEFNALGTAGVQAGQRLAIPGGL